jgi:hypothetical protein
MKCKLIELGMLTDQQYAIYDQARRDWLRMQDKYNTYQCDVALEHLSHQYAMWQLNRLEREYRNTRRTTYNKRWQNE